MQLRAEFDRDRRKEEEDIEALPGFIRLTTLVLRLKVGALAWFAIPCNSFGFMSSSQHQRSKSWPFGDCSHQWVRAANLIASRIAIMASITIARRAYWGAENPSQSKLILFPYLCHLKQILGDLYFEVRWWPD